MTPPSVQPRQIVMAAFDGAEMVDVVGPLEVFSVASRVMAYRGEGVAPGEPAYRVEIVAEHAGPLRMESGLQIFASRSIRSHRGTLDTLLVPGGAGVNVMMHRPRYMAWLARTAQTTRRV